MDKFFSELQKPQKQSDATGTEEQAGAEPEKKKKLPRGVVLGKDGKPCRSCMSSASWIAMMKQEGRQSPSSSATSQPTSSTTGPLTFTSSSPPLPPQPCPPDVERLGRSTWTFLHTLSASYPRTATPVQQSEMSQFLTLFGRLYPCWHCAEDFQQWMRTSGNEPRLGGREGLMRWMCEAHNEVNVKLGKGRFDCGVGRLEERWGEGPGDGRCG